MNKLTVREQETIKYIEKITNMVEKLNGINLLWV